MYYTYDHSVRIVWVTFQRICYANWLIGLCVIWTLWSECIVLILYMFYLFYLSIYLLCVILCYIRFCLFILLILLFAVVNVVAAYSFLNLFHCSCPGFSMYFMFFYVFCCLCCHCVLEHCFPFSIAVFLTHCISKIYCHRYLYDLALAFVVWLLTLLVYNFPYGDFIVN